MTEDDIEWAEIAWTQYEWWGHNDKRVRDRISELIEATLAAPFSGIGKPEPLRGVLSGRWSRRITKEHRLVYEVRDGSLVIHLCRFHC